MESSTNKTSKNLTKDTLNPCLRNAKFFMSRTIANRLREIQKELRNGVKKPFKQVYRSDLGDSQAMGQKPITFIRQVLALLINPELLQESIFPEDAKARAKEILNVCRGNSIGSYTDPYGMEIIRKHCAQFIEERDEGIPSDWQNIFLGAGSMTCISGVLQLLTCDINSKKSGIMVPIPQYRVYQATLSEHNLHQINYYLDESNNWGLNISELQRALQKAKKVSYPRAIVIINPGNPTGHVLTKGNIQEIVKFAQENNLIIFADEVYQQNVYDQDSKFFSFKRIIMEMGLPYSEIELFSFMSCSKGYMGECGIRGGFVEMVNIDPHVKQMYMENINILLCPGTMGQVVVDVVCNPPKQGDPSYNQYMIEKSRILKSLKDKAELVRETFDKIEGITCNLIQGSLYGFPRIYLPIKFVEEAKSKLEEPDTLYAMKLLEETGICIVPGSSFGQKPGTYHFRITILQQSDELKYMLQLFKSFHESFIKKYS